MTILNMHGVVHHTLYVIFIIIILSYYEPLTISPVAAQCNGACGKRSSIECTSIDAGPRNHGDGV